MDPSISSSSSSQSSHSSAVASSLWQPTPLKVGLLWSAGWWLAVLSASAGLTWLGGIVALIIGAWLINAQPRRWWRYSILLIFGVAVEFIKVSHEVLAYQHSTLLVPLWIVGLWLLWIVGCDYSLLPAVGRKLTWIITVVGAPFAYIGGASFGALQLEHNFAWLIITAVYALAASIAVWLLQSGVSNETNNNNAVNHALSNNADDYPEQAK